MKVRYLLTYLILFFYSCVCMAQGVKFAGMESPIDRRTSIGVFASGAPAFTDSFSIGFDWEIYPESEIGYIFRVKNADNEKVYNLFYDGKGTDHMFQLNDEGCRCLIRARLPRQSIAERWTEMKVDFDLERDSVHFYCAGEHFAASVDLPDTYEPSIFFGRSEHIIDVPSFAIRNLRVGNSSKSYLFPLSEMEGNVAHDSIHGKKAEVINPDWLINESYQWKLLGEMSLDSVAASGYSAGHKKFYYFSGSEIHTFDPSSLEWNSSRFSSGCPVEMKLGMSIPDVGEEACIYVYEPYASMEMTGDVSVASLDLNTLSWTVLGHDRIDMQVHHNAPFRTGDADMPIAFFGGFGNQKYNDILYCFDRRLGTWAAPYKYMGGDRICPRYFTSAGMDTDSGLLYIYGGMGNDSGEQVVGRRYLYDLYCVDLDGRTVKKLWENRMQDVKMVPVRNMIVTDPGHFITLCYPESVSNSNMQLYRFSIEDGTMTALATEIPIRSDKISTNANLYYDEPAGRLYVTVQEYDDDIKSTLKIYSLACPPLSEDELLSYATVFRQGGAAIYIILPLCLILALAAVYFALIRKKPSEAHGRASAGTFHADAPTEWLTLSSRPNSIFLFGDFLVRDRNGDIISSSFTTRQRQMFCLALQRGEEGISSKRLSSILWPDATEEQAKNSRGVNISNLRKALRNLDDVSFVYNGGRFRIETGPAFYCDYIRCHEIMASSAPDYDELSAILSGGRFLRFTQEPIFDDFKLKVESELVQFLSVEMERRFAVMDYDGTVVIANAVLMVEPLNERALELGVRSLKERRRTAEALEMYSAFVSEYKVCYDCDYPKKINEL